MKKFRPALAVFMAILTVCLLCGTAFADDAAADEDVVEASELIAADEEVAEVEEAPAAEEQAPARGVISKGALSTIVWALVFLGFGFILIVVANKKTGKGKKKKEDDK